MIYLEVWQLIWYTKVSSYHICTVNSSSCDSIESQITYFSSDNSTSF
jgi:hypothetical protein